MFAIIFRKLYLIFATIQNVSAFLYFLRVLLFLILFNPNHYCCFPCPHDFVLQFTLAESELKLCLSNEENEKSKLVSLQSTYENNKQIIAERTEAVNMLKKKIPLTEKSLSSATEELNAVKYEEAQLITDIRKKRGALEETRSSMQASRTRSKVLDRLMEQKRNGRCPGLFSRLVNINNSLM